MGRRAVKNGEVSYETSETQDGWQSEVTITCLPADMGISAWVGEPAETEKDAEHNAADVALAAIKEFAPAASQTRQSGGGSGGGWLDGLLVDKKQAKNSSSWLDGLVNSKGQNKSSAQAAGGSRGWLSAHLEGAKPQASGRGWLAQFDKAAGSGGRGWLDSHVNAESTSGPRAKQKQTAKGGGWLSSYVN